MRRVVNKELTLPCLSKAFGLGMKQFVVTSTHSIKSIITTLRPEESWLSSSPAFSQRYFCAHTAIASLSIPVQYRYGVQCGYGLAEIVRLIEHFSWAHKCGVTDLDYCRLQIADAVAGYSSYSYSYSYNNYNYNHLCRLNLPILRPPGLCQRGMIPGVTLSCA